MRVLCRNVYAVLICLRCGQSAKPRHPVTVSCATTALRKKSCQDIASIIIAHSRRICNRTFLPFLSAVESLQLATLSICVIAKKNAVKSTAPNNSTVKRVVKIRLYRPIFKVRVRCASRRVTNSSNMIIILVVQIKCRLKLFTDLHKELRRTRQKLFRQLFDDLHASGMRVAVHFIRYAARQE